MSKSADAFRTISEVSEWLGTPSHVLRFWESRFPQIKPLKRAGGRRYYRPSDMALLGGIKKLLHDDGITIRGVQKILREKGIKHVASFAPEIAGMEYGADISAPLTSAPPSVEPPSTPPVHSATISPFRRPGETEEPASGPDADPAGLPDQDDATWPVEPGAPEETADDFKDDLGDEEAPFLDAAHAKGAPGTEAEVPETFAQLHSAASDDPRFGSIADLPDPGDVPPELLDDAPIAEGWPQSHAEDETPPELRENADANIAETLSSDPEVSAVAPEVADGDLTTSEDADENPEAEPGIDTASDDQAIPLRDPDTDWLSVDPDPEDDDAPMIRPPMAARLRDLALLNDAPKGGAQQALAVLHRRLVDLRDTLAQREPF